jgi:hypothetical protein
MKFCIRKNLGNLFMACCAAALSTTALATEVESSASHSVTVDKAVIDYSLNSIMGITITEDDLRAIQTAASGEYQYVQIGSAQMCIGSNSMDGLPISIDVGALTISDSITDTATPSTANMIAMVHSESTLPGIGTDYDDIDSLNGRALIISSTEDFSTNIPIFKVIDSTGVSLEILTFTNGNTDLITKQDGAINSTGKLTSSDTFSHTNFISKNGSAATANHVNLRHRGIVDASVTPALYVDSDLTTTTLGENNSEDVAVSNCAESLLKLRLFVSADDALDLRPGSYTTTVTVNAEQ